jgi:PAS domain S-box-containing protein
MRPCGDPPLPPEVAAVLPLLHAHPRPVLAVPRRTRQVVPNAAATAWLDDPGGAEGMAAWERAWPGLRPLLDRAFAGEAMSGAPAERAGGAAFAADLVPLRGGDGGVAGAIVTLLPAACATAPEGGARAAGIAQDVAGTLRELRESEARFRTLAHGVPQLVWRAGPRGAWRWASPQWVAATGLSDEASRGDGWLEAVDAADRPAAEEAWRRAPCTGQLAFDARLRTAAGPRWFQTRAAPVRDTRGGIVEWLGTCTDVEEEVRARDALRRGGETLEAAAAHRTAALHETMPRLRREAAERHAPDAKLRQGERLQAIGQLTGGIAHDFNNMLQAVLAALSMMRARLEAGRVDGLARYIDRAEAGAERAAALTRRLLAFARQQVLQPEPVNLDRVARGMAGTIRRSVGPGIGVELRPRDGRWLVLCDAGGLENALLNLCDNARDAMPEGGWLTVATEDTVLTGPEAAGIEGARPGRFVTLTVADTGTGMPPEVAQRVFEPFFTTKPVGKGTGLGLSQIWGFVQQSGGFMTIDTAPGRGTAVRIALPFHAEDPQPEAPARPDLGRTVLLVDDEEDVRELAAESLRGEGYRVLEAASAEAALRLLGARLPVDVLVTDVGMPGPMDGLGLLAAVRQDRPGLPAVVVTGHAGGQAVGGAVLLRKPYKPAALIEALRRLRERRG